MQIAQRAGVTQMTVSRALRGSTDVSPKTAERIRRIAEEMGYQPNPLVSSLMRTRRRGVKGSSGLVIGWHGNVSALRKEYRDNPRHFDSYGQILEGAKSECHRNGFELEIFEPDPQDAALPRMIKARGIKALVLGPIGYSAKRSVDFSGLQGVHLMRLGRDHREHWYDRVASDSFEEMRICIDKLVEQGCRRLGYIDTEGHEQTSQGLWRGAFQSYVRGGVALLPVCLPNALQQQAGGIAEDFIETHQPDGMVVSSKMFMRVAPDILQAKGIPFCCLERNGRPDSISGVETDFHQIGVEAVHLLINKILSPHRPPTSRRTISVHGRWHEGQSHLANEQKPST